MIFTSKLNANKMDTNLDVPGIIKRAKQALNLKRDSELAEFLGVSRATVTNWAARNSIDFRLLLNKLGNTVDYNWLLLGKGNPKHQSRFCESELAQGEVQIIHNPKTAEPVDDRSVTLYDITAAANLKTLFTNKHQYALGKYGFRTYPPATGRSTSTGTVCTPY